MRRLHFPVHNQLSRRKIKLVRRARTRDTRKIPAWKKCFSCPIWRPCRLYVWRGGSWGLPVFAVPRGRRTGMITLLTYLTFPRDGVISDPACWSRYGTTLLEVTLHAPAAAITQESGLQELEISRKKLKRNRNFFLPKRHTNYSPQGQACARVATEYVNGHGTSHAKI